MINLLPQKEREELLQEEKFKLILILGIVFVAFFLSLALILFSIRISISKDVEIQKMILAEKEKVASLNQDLETEIKYSNSTLSKLDSFYGNQISLIEILEKISTTLPSGTYLTNFNFTLTQKEEKGVARISLSGFCPNRETLLSFKSNLENEKNFSDIYFPPENWVKPKDITFTVNLTIAE